MADLSTLDPTAPLDTDPASQGASQIRTERADLLGWAAVEHALTGPHKFLVGATGALPTAGNAGRIYINTDTNALMYDTGSAWVTLGGGIGKSFVSTPAGLVVTGSYQDLASTTIASVAGQWIMAIATCSVVFAASGPANAKIRITLDGTALNSAADGVEFTQSVSGFPTTIPMMIQGVTSTPTAGTHTVAFQGLTSVGTTVTISRRMMMVMAL